jgi:hypothetical protein
MPSAQFQIKWLMDRTHVSATEAQVAEDIGNRLISNNPEATPLQVLGCIGYALQCHEKNRDHYHSVMGPH